jgi:hypothetical protein
MFTVQQGVATTVGSERELEKESKYISVVFLFI